MSRRTTGAVPNAWDDDDWISQSTSKAAAAEAPAPPLNKQERMQQHVEANRKLWESADTQETFHYIEANTGGAPLNTTSYKPQVKVLSRKPLIAKKNIDPTTGMPIHSPYDDDEDETRLQAGAAQLTPEEIRAKQKKEREEKQRRYDEARAKIFGESAPSSRGSSPGTGTVTPPRSDGRNASGRGRGRGGSYRGNSSNNVNANNSNNNYFNNGSGNGAGNNHNNAGNYSFDNRRPMNPMASTRELYDPNSSPRPESNSRGRGGSSSSGGENSPRVQTPREEQHQVQHHAIRSPRGPDSSGRGGFAFARRGARET